MLWAMVPPQSDHRRTMLATASVAKAFYFSILLHAIGILSLELGYQTGLWKSTFLFSRPPSAIEELAHLQAQPQPQEQEIPLVFIEVDPAQATPEPPKDARFYSSLSSRAANPDTQKDTLTPKIDGRQEHVPRTTDRAEPDPEPLQVPETAPPPQVAETKPEPQPPPAPQPPPPPAPRDGDLAFSRPVEKPRPELDRRPAPPPERPAIAPERPRTLEAARRARGGMAGEKVKQAGGVKRFSLEPAFDVRATPFGSYDAAIIAAIQKRWYDLLAGRDFAASYSGKVVLEFRLNSDGRITDMRVSENGVTGLLALLCQRAVQDPAPFKPWPPDLKRMVGKEFREVRFTFYYN